MIRSIRELSHASSHRPQQLIAYADAAAEILRRHDSNEPEANITSAVRDFLILTGLARSEEITEENPPSPDGSRRAVDLTALDTFVEVKRRIGTTGGLDPNPEYVHQIDDYLDESAKRRKRCPYRDTDRRQILAAAMARRGRGQNRQALRLHPGRHPTLASAVRVAARRRARVTGRHPS